MSATKILSREVRIWVSDVLWDNRNNVMDLPCICDTPELHAEECRRLRAIANSIILWRQRNGWTAGLVALRRERDEANESAKEHATRANKNHDAALGFQNRALRAEAELAAAIEAGKTLQAKLALEWEKDGVISERNSELSALRTRLEAAMGALKYYAGLGACACTKDCECGHCKARNVLAAMQAAQVEPYRQWRVVGEQGGAITKQMPDETTARRYALDWNGPGCTPLTPQYSEDGGNTWFAAQPEPSGNPGEKS